VLLNAKQVMIAQSARAFKPGPQAIAYRSFGCLKNGKGLAILAAL
jgi:hypothetical protein